MSSPSPTNAPAAELGRLILVPNTLDLGTTPEPIETLLSPAVLACAAGLQHWVVENAKSARAFLKRVDAQAPLRQPLQALSIMELPRPRKGDPNGHIDAKAWRELLAPALAGQDLGLLSEAGLPAVADPGAALVQAAHALGVTVRPLPGASSLTLALAASGLNGQRFAFEGYLPQAGDARAQRVRELEQRSRREGQTQLVIETPYRNQALIEALLQLLHPETHLSVACGLTSADGWCRTQPVSRWRQDKPQMPAHLPAVFLWQAS